MLFNFSQDSIQSLEELKWKKRIVLGFQNTENVYQLEDDSLQSMIQERKVAYFLIDGQKVISNLETNFSDSYISQLYSRYKMGSKNDCWVLIGLDGGIKIRKDTILDWTLIFKTIDSMPMRRSEGRKIDDF
ncbi:DUF4174 domain-containing protein [Belliella buryatensis]|nr:DUF4174 domain-containing protein [Belliella buryatensis]